MRLIAKAILISACIGACLLPAGLACQKDKANPAGATNNAGKTLKDSLIAKAAEEMVAIPGGTFQMGSTSYEPPVHSVTITAFKMGSTEITQELYKVITGSNPANFDSGATYPVEEVSWYDAALFCNALSKMSGKDTVYTYTGIIDSNVVIDYTKNGYRMPTEAEWEYACRAGTATDYYWGKSYPQTARDDTLAMDSNAVWYHNSENHTRAVAGKKPNAWGLYDMSGNVWEWVNDWYGDYASGAQTDPTGPGIPGTNRLLRGGGWNSNGYLVRSAVSFNVSPNYRFGSFGFRIACRP